MDPRPTSSRYLFTTPDGTPLGEAADVAGLRDGSLTVVVMGASDALAEALCEKAEALDVDVASAAGRVRSRLCGARVARLSSLRRDGSPCLLIRIEALRVFPPAAASGFAEAHSA